MVFESQHRMWMWPQTVNNKSFIASNRYPIENVTHHQVWTNGGPEYNLMLPNINNGIKESIRGYQNCNTCQNIDIWRVSQNEAIFVYSSYYLGQYHFKSYLN